MSVFAEPGKPQRRFDEMGGLSSSHIVVCLKEDTFRRIAAARASMQADFDILPRLNHRFRTTAANWRSIRMHRVTREAFARPALAERHALDRTFVLEVPTGTDTEALAAAIAAVTDEVEFATPDVIGGVATDPLVPDDSFFELQWAMHNTGQFVQTQTGIADADIDAPEAWAIHAGDFGTVTVAVLDSGINSHPEFGINVPPYPNGRIVQGYNTVLNSSNYQDLQDTCPHGTHVAGIIAAGGNDYRCSFGSVNAGSECESVVDCQPACLSGTNVGEACASNEDCPLGSCGSPTCEDVGVAGVSWGAYLMPVKVLTDCNGNSSDLAEGIRWAADHGADVINMSLQYNITNVFLISALQDAIDYAHDSGVHLVGAAGNNGSCGLGQVCYPAKADNVIGVSATDNRDNFPSFSNFGPQIDVCAPGKDIWSTMTNGSYAYNFGTSMSTPHVSGLAALIKSYVPELTHDDIGAIIMATAEDLGLTGWDDHFGYGRINAYKALKAAEVWPGILESDPPDRAIDARQPLDRVTQTVQGWSEVTIKFPRELGGVASGDFAVSQTTAGAGPIVVDVQPIDAERVRVVLDRPIDPGAWTTITHVPTETRVRLGFLPGDVNGDGTSAPVDILALVDFLNGVGPDLPVWSTDIDRSDLAAPADILQEVDLLNGAVPYDVFNGATLPSIP